MEENMPVMLEIAKEMENMKLPSPELVAYYNDFNDRKIYITCDIDESLFDVVRQIMIYNKEDRDNGIPAEKRKKIYVYIYSYGGDLTAAYSLINTIMCSQTPVVTVNLGNAMSAGALIFLAGNERYTHKFGTVLLHSGSGGTGGTFEQVEAQMDNYKKLVAIMKDYIIERTNIDSKLYAKNAKKDWYITADECIQLGIATKIITNLDEII